MKLEHVALNVPDPQATAAWYRDQLGLRIAKAEGEPQFIHFLADEQGSMLEFYRNPAAEVPSYWDIDPFTLHLAFATDDIDQARAQLTEAGGRAEGEIATNPAGDKLAFVRDPWGVAIQLVMRAKAF